MASDTLMKSEIGATMPLRPLAQAGNMYALGPVSGIKGEVAMWDSDPVMGMIVNGKPAIVRNIDAFHEAFGVGEGDGMWLDPADRVSVF